MYIISEHLENKISNNCGSEGERNNKKNCERIKIKN